MRISKRTIEIINRAIKDSFGSVKVYLFGSRVDDNKKGGDIDIAIKCDISEEDFREKR